MIRRKCKLANLYKMWLRFVENDENLRESYKRMMNV